MESDHEIFLLMIDPLLLLAKSKVEHHDNDWMIVVISDTGTDQDLRSSNSKSWMMVLEQPAS